MCLVLSEVEIGRNDQPTFLCRAKCPSFPMRSAHTPSATTRASRRCWSASSRTRGPHTPQRGETIKRGGSFVGRPFLVAGTAGSEGVVVLNFDKFAPNGSLSLAVCYRAAADLDLGAYPTRRGWAAGRITLSY